MHLANRMHVLWQTVALPAEAIARIDRFPQLGPSVKERTSTICTRQRQSNLSTNNRTVFSLKAGHDRLNQYGTLSLPTVLSLKGKYLLCLLADVREPV